MRLTNIQSLTITARISAVVGAETFDRPFAGVEFDEVDGDTVQNLSRFGARGRALTAVLVKPGNPTRM